MSNFSENYVVGFEESDKAAMYFTTAVFKALEPLLEGMLLVERDDNSINVIFYNSHKNTLKRVGKYQLMGNKLHAFIRDWDFSTPNLQVITECLNQLIGCSYAFANSKVDESIDQITYTDVEDWAVFTAQDYLKLFEIGKIKYLRNTGCRGILTQLNNNHLDVCAYESDNLYAFSDDKLRLDFFKTESAKVYNPFLCIEDFEFNERVGYILDFPQDVKKCERVLSLTVTPVHNDIVLPKMDIFNALNTPR